MNDTDGWRNHAESFESLHAPFKEFVTLGVAAEFLTEIFEERIRGAGAVDLDRVVDDEIDGDERFDDGAIFSETCDGFAHGGEVD